MRERPTVRNLLTSSRFLALNGGLSEARSASSDVVLPFEGHLRKAMSESGRLKLLWELAESTVTITSGVTTMYCTVCTYLLPTTQMRTHEYY